VEERKEGLGIGGARKLSALGNTKRLVATKKELLRGRKLAHEKKRWGGKSIPLGRGSGNSKQKLKGVSQ